MSYTKGPRPMGPRRALTTPPTREKHFRPPPEMIAAPNPPPPPQEPAPPAIPIEATASPGPMIGRFRGGGAGRPKLRLRISSGGALPDDDAPAPDPPPPPPSSLDANGVSSAMPIPSPAPGPRPLPCAPLQASSSPPPLLGTSSSPSEMMRSSRMALYQGTSTRPRPLLSLSLRNDLPPLNTPARPSLAVVGELEATLNISDLNTARGAEEWSDDVLEVLARLGEGAGGAVCKVQDTRSGRVMARKTIPTGTVPARQLLRELQFSKLVHPNLVAYYGAYIALPPVERGQNNHPVEIHILMELCEGGALDAIARQMKTRHANIRIGEKVIARLAEDVLKGLDYMHSNKMIHRDIKPSNILVTGSGVVKLCDFGVSGELEASLANTFTGTSWYMSPERITGNAYSIRADVWSTGLTFLELAQNRFPYPPDFGPLELLTSIVNGETPELEDEPGDENGNGAIHWSSEMKSFIKQCLRIEAATRPTPREMLRHPWIQESKTSEVDMAKWIRKVWGWESTVSSSMNSSEIAAVLVSHGCVDLTQQLDTDSCSKFAVSKGGFGDVYTGSLTNGTRIAIKTSRIRAIHDRSGKELKHAARELYTWSKCEHPNILRLLGLVQFRGQIGMVSQWIENGSICRYLERCSNANRLQLCYGICNGLAYLHSNDIIHGDLKGANVLVSNDETPLLTDFGNSVLDNRTLKFTKTCEKFNVSCRWTAPEVLEEVVSSSYSADIFSLGMTLLETITGDVPYRQLSDQAVVWAISVNKQIPARPEEHLLNNERDNMLWSLFEQCWNFNPEHRPSADQVREKMLEIVNMSS